jgi:hypothetical protein
LLAPVASWGAAKAPAKAASKKAAPAAATIATVGRRRIDATDIQRAARALASDPLRKKDPAAWRRMLLDRVADRELLALAAEQRDLAKDPVLAKRISDREYSILLRSLYEKVLVPGLTPTKDELAKIREEGLHRGVDLYYLILRDDASGANRPLALRIYQAAKSGARFDSLVQKYSGHPPSAAARGHFGWVLARDLDPASYAALRQAKPGDVLGVYSGMYGHEIYKIGGFDEPSDDSLFTLVYQERKRAISRDYEARLLRQYHFVLDSTQVQRVVFATGSETPDSILASLGPDGTRPERGVRPALGILATCDGDTVTMDDVIRSTPPVLGRTGRMRLRDAETLYRLSARAVLPKLTMRDARERGLDKDPEVARELRLSRDRILTDAMVERNRAALPDEAALRAYYEKNRASYQRPRTAIARVAVHADRDSAAALLAAARSQGGLTEAFLVSRGYEEKKGRTVPNLGPLRREGGPRGLFTTAPLSATEGDTLGRAAGGVAVNDFLPVMRAGQGYVVAQVLSVEEPRPLTFEEAARSVRRDWLEDGESGWVEKELAKLRTKYPVQVQPGRLESVKLASVSSSAGGSNP